MSSQREIDQNIEIKPEAIENHLKFIFFKHVKMI